MTRYRSFAPSTGTFVVVPEENEKSEPFSNRKQVRIFLVWWARVDSNHRSWKQQIYSLSPLATREHAHILFAVIADCLYILSSEVAFVNYFFHGFSLFLSFSIFLRFTAIKALPITAKDPKTFSVLRSFWSWWQELNLQPTDYKSVALPLRHTSKGYLNSITQARQFGKDCFLQGIIMPENRQRW